MGMKFKISDDEPRQVHLNIDTDYGYTADFLRMLANAIEESDHEIREFETFEGMAELEWE